MTNQALLLVLLALAVRRQRGGRAVPRERPQPRSVARRRGRAGGARARVGRVPGDGDTAQVVRLDFAWLPALGLDFTLRMDGFAWMFAMLVTGIGFLVVLYARYYMSPQDPVPRFFSFFLAFMGSMLGVVLSGNLIQLVFFWELTSLFSFLLIGYWHHNAAARDGARMALIVTSAGGLCLFAGVLLLGHIVGSYDLDARARCRRRDPLARAVPAGARADRCSARSRRARSSRSTSGCRTRWRRRRRSRRTCIRPRW